MGSQCLHEKSDTRAKHLTRRLGPYRKDKNDSGKSQICETITRTIQIFELRIESLDT